MERPPVRADRAERERGREGGWEAEGWAVPLMPIWPGDVIKLTYWFLWIYECLFHKLHFQSRGLFRALSFFPPNGSIMCPRNPVTWETHAYFSHLRRFTGRTDSHYVHINKLEVFLFFPLLFVCVTSPSLLPPPPSSSSPPNISDCFLPPPVSSYESLPGGALTEVFPLFPSLPLVEIPIYSSTDTNITRASSCNELHVLDPFCLLNHKKKKQTS